MEYVAGEPITSYCDRHTARPSRSDSSLFLAVCEGVQHAHQKGIIHRDLKPSNVLVTLQDDRPVPKIIDFGIAKATTQTLTERTLSHGVGAIVGTPEYMSPEQAEMTGLDVDTRTDVYSLGVVLYRAAHGRAAVRPRTLLRGESLDEIRRDDPRSRSAAAEHAGHAARRRAADAPRVSSAERRRAWRAQLRGDLDWITMKALEKDRTRRYGSVGGARRPI